MASELHYRDDPKAYQKEYAQSLDSVDPLRHFREEFIIPSKKDLKRKVLAVDGSTYIHAIARALRGK